MTGAASNPIPVVFLQGIIGAARLWDPQLASFRAAGYEPVALDLPGYGARAPVDRMAFDMLAADVEAGGGGAQARPPGHRRSFVWRHDRADAALRRRPQGYRAAVLVRAPARPSATPSGDFQKKFVADRLGPLDAGKTMADIAPGDRPISSWAPQADAPNRALFIEVDGGRSRRAPIAPRCNAWLASTSAPILSTSRSRYCASSASSTATRRRP